MVAAFDTPDGAKNGQLWQKTAHDKAEVSGAAWHNVFRKEGTLGPGHRLNVTDPPRSVKASEVGADINEDNAEGQVEVDACEKEVPETETKEEERRKRRSLGLPATFPSFDSDKIRRVSGRLARRHPAVNACGYD
ncbi:hypothetical protein MIND_01355300 [Mycena indigotica]|uniref:Uncharacterized protein n=1 Tax=Mycena indigotica TaxID=2126181 RepID=A0A8H6S1X6_9AGAR|nr:uncharacterized protein MIND_01355300 [Mycena indigotica]KAF7289810.1 hypothetical protein MIND_01355300 [Mycena indigotica]